MIIIALIALAIIVIIGLTIYENNRYPIKNLISQYYTSDPLEPKGSLSVCAVQPENAICKDRSVRLSGVVYGVDQVTAASGSGFRQYFLFDKFANSTNLNWLGGIALCLDGQHKIGCDIPGQSPRSAQCYGPFSEGKEYFVSGILTLNNSFGVPCFIVENWEAD